MTEFVDLFTSPEIWIALIGGGGLLKLIEWILKRVLDRRLFRINADQTEKTSLRSDIDYLRSEVAALRVEVSELKGELDRKDAQINIWQKRYWEKSAALDRLIVFLRYQSSDETRQGAGVILQAMEEAGVVESEDYES